MEIHEDNIGWDIQLAKTIKGLTHTKPPSIGANMGVVLSKPPAPLIVQLYSGDVIIQSNIHEVYLSDKLDKSSNWKVGDKVLIIADSNNQVFFVVDVIVKVV